MSNSARSRRSRAFRPGNIGFDHLEARKLLTVDYDLMIIPDVSATEDFDPDDYDLVSLTTLEMSLMGFEPDALALPGEVEGGEAGTRSALITDLRNRKAAEIDGINNNIATLQARYNKLGELRKKIDDLYNYQRSVGEPIGQIPPSMRTPEQVTQYGQYQDAIDTLAKSYEEIWKKRYSILEQIHQLNLHKYYLNTTYCYMEGIIEEMNQAADPTDPPQYVYRVATTQLITT